MLKKWQGYLATLESNRGKAHLPMCVLPLFKGVLITQEISTLHAR
jgi:hypothetical protein